MVDGDHVTLKVCRFVVLMTLLHVAWSITDLALTVPLDGVSPPPTWRQLPRLRLVVAVTDCGTFDRAGENDSAPVTDVHTTDPCATDAGTLADDGVVTTTQVVATTAAPNTARKGALPRIECGRRPP
jgi:hypothetical protein